MLSLKKLCILIALPLGLFSCKKKGETKTERTPYELLTTGSWKLVQAYENTDKDGAKTSTDLYAGMDECEKDDIKTFARKDNEVVHDQGPIKCDDSEPQTSVSQTWVLVSNTSIEFSSVFFDEKYEAGIIELSENVFHFRRYRVLGDGTYVETTYIYNKAN
jgi:hypothetical protein